ncbi:hypothetical protein L218DRAFT_857950 [Marasmius fiardii PR-910]|nr:hypothetical protein L218DRAFT_857950 [Marasmius fiardii PR-910]
MASFNVTTTGARINSVGVGGFLLGGGIAFASVDRGFGANNVFNYEVVLSNGTIVSASKDNNPDLFWALKLAGTNYGIVTRYDMITYPSPVIWGAVTAYPITNQSVTDLLKDYEQYGHDNTNTKDFKSFAFAQSNGTEMISTVEVNLDGVPRTPATSVEPLVRTEKVGNTHDVVNDVIAGALAASARTHWYTFTTKIGTDYFQDLYAEALQIFKPLESCQGLAWTVGLQALQKSFIAQTAGTPIFNALHLPNDDLVFILLLVTWEDPSDELVLRNATDALGAWGEAEARRRGLLADFVYLNYANEEQHIYERSVTEQDLDKMRDLQKAYDPSGTFVKLWRGGYKIPEKSYHGAETGTGAAEEGGGL